MASKRAAEGVPSLLQIFGSPGKGAAAAGAKAGGQAALTPTASKRLRRATDGPALATISPEKAVQQKPEATTVEGDVPSTGKKAQKRVNDKKNKEEERRKAMELLEAYAGKFTGIDEILAATPAPSDAEKTASALAEDAEEHSDSEDVEDVTWSQQRRSLAAAWASPSGEPGATQELSSPDFDVAAAASSPQDLALFTSLVVPLFEAIDQCPKRAVYAIANAVRQIIRREDSEDILTAFLTVLLSDRRVPHRHLSEAVSAAFKLQGLIAGPKLADVALAQRLKQRTLFQRTRVQVADVAAMLEEYAAMAVEAPASRGKMHGTEVPGLVERLKKLVVNSVSEGRETWHLIRVLLGSAGLSWNTVLRGVAHAAVLSPPGGQAPSWANEEARQEAMLKMEDAVFQAYAEDGGRVQRLVKALTSGSLSALEACGPVAGVRVFQMRAESQKDAAAALDRFGAGAVLAEWMLLGERAQVHVMDGGKCIRVFNKKGLRPERDAEASALLVGQLKEIESCILEVVFLKAARKPDGVASEATPGQMMLFDVLEINGLSLTRRPLRERRAKLFAAIKESPLLKFAKGAEIPADKVTVEEVSAELDKALGASSLASVEDKLFTRASGLLLKRLDGPEAVYMAGRRASAWQTLEKPPLKGPEADKKLLETLTPEERKHIPPSEAFHFSVVSGFRTRSVEGITDILRIQRLYNDAGVVPTWYTDTECPEEYRKLGLKVVPSGKLIPSRNRALEDAFAAGKICVQTSDDIGLWQFCNDFTKYTTDEEANAAHKRVEKLNVSPVAAGKFLAAKMRARGEVCKLAGVYPLGNGGRAMRAEPSSSTNFILGDFFAADVSECRFDERLSLKEDYDFTASHLQRYGEAFRSNRLIITAKHETNAGGACDVRDAAGERERYNIGILKEKWPGAIGDHPTRANQIVLRWKSLRKEKDEAVDKDMPDASATSAAADGGA
mmetsp:Transcript_9556/g.21323  ORF Transcript_9556/g.21323 Transcript_9556/m.21323 type:complete len:957 (-) Transcript_9556:83-2953(-)|eukprot:CAMPEP_0170601990 /NCGR_PEP_ID=MMETSP0224-20130122/18154_1 /TAXON_ID=285029 /ORGANISM="Togula jolla, Strain CCCM 725" /LENGTH=956 /DNA_ID=CAMNT_0010926803 /DNA_START=8 /DNA_END=2878 /DNA_ORIENTATION=-